VAYRQVAAIKGAPGVGDQALREFETRLKDNLARSRSGELGALYAAPRSRRWRCQNPTEEGTRVLGARGLRRGGPDDGGRRRVGHGITIARTVS
jgi:hypothetical protein